MHDFCPSLFTYKKNSNTISEPKQRWTSDFCNSFLLEKYVVPLYSVQFQKISKPPWKVFQLEPPNLLKIPVTCKHHAFLFLLKPPFPLEFLLTFPWVCMDISSNCTMTTRYIVLCTSYLFEYFVQNPKMILNVVWLSQCNCFFAGFILFVLNLKKEHYKVQFSLVNIICL